MGMWRGLGELGVRLAGRMSRRMDPPFPSRVSHLNVPGWVAACGGSPEFITPFWGREYTSLGAVVPLLFGDLILFIREPFWFKLLLLIRILPWFRFWFGPLLLI